MEKAIDRLEKAVLPSDGKAPDPTALTEVLLAMKPRAPRIPVGNIEFFDPNLNDSQKEAIKFCLESPEVACIHGPPGKYIPFPHGFSFASKWIFQAPGKPIPS
jgi:DNA polymerase alpha-associated DNA helicase A